MKSELEQEVLSTFAAIEDKSDTEIEDIFKYHFEVMPSQLEEQLKEYKSFLEGGK
jgi:pyruvate dehydrogenase E1 component alpha subunit